MKIIIFIISTLVMFGPATGATAQRWGNAAPARVAVPADSLSAEGYRRVRGDYEFARVVDVRPIMRLVTVRVPRRECWRDEVFVENRRRGTAGATIAGGLIGGAVGRQFGGGSGRDAMTLVGAIVGSAIGSDHARAAGRDGRFETVQRCETWHDVREEERIDGYDVTYLYNGREYTTRTRQDPGPRLRVRVSVLPAGRY